MSSPFTSVTYNGVVWRDDTDDPPTQGILVLTLNTPIFNDGVAVYPEDAVTTIDPTEGIFQFTCNALDDIDTTGATSYHVRIYDGPDLLDDFNFVANAADGDSVDLFSKTRVAYPAPT